MFDKLKTIFWSIVIGGIITLVIMIRFQRKKEVQIDTTRVTIVTQLQATQRLTTSIMNLDKVIEGKEQMTDFLPGITRDDSIVGFLFKDEIGFEAHAIIEAGFDLSKINTGAIVVNDDLSLTITLPKPEILSRKLTEDTKPFMRKTGVLTKGSIDLESQIRGKSLENFEKEAIQKGILLEATKNAKAAFSNLFGAIGIQVKDVKIEGSSSID